MAKKLVAVVKLQIPAGKANPAPPVGPALGQLVLTSWTFVRTLTIRRLKKAMQ